MLHGMSTIAVEDLGAIFVDPAAYADPEAWHAAAQRIREESPILKVHIEGYPDFWAITTHADVMEVERNPEVFTNAPYPTVTPSSHVDAATNAPVKTLIQMDGDQHKAHRNIVNDWFKPASLKHLAGADRHPGDGIRRPDGRPGRSLRLRQRRRRLFPPARHPGDPGIARGRLPAHAQR